MSAIKFSCPQCQQHIECDASHAGRDVPCPTCHSTLRVPKASAATTQGEPPRAKLVATGVPKPQETGETPKAKSPKSPKIPGDARVRIPKAAREGAAGGLEAAGEKPVRTAVHCQCPVCGSELRVPASSGAEGDAPEEAILVRRGSVPLGPATGGDDSSQGKAGKTAAKSKAADLAMRAAQSARSSGELKPRMSYVLTGKPPAPKSAKTPRTD
jgi:ribosomal protein S27E